MTAQVDDEKSVRIIIFDRSGGIMAAMPEQQTRQDYDGMSRAVRQIMSLIRTSPICRIYLPTPPSGELCRSVLIRGMEHFSGIYVLISDIMEDDALVEHWQHGSTPVLRLPVQDDSTLSPLIRSALHAFYLGRAEVPDAKALCAAIADTVGVRLVSVRRGRRLSEADCWRDRLRTDGALLSVKLLLTFMALRLCGGSQAVLLASSSDHRLELELPELRLTPSNSGMLARCQQLAGIYDTVYLLSPTAERGMSLMLDAGVRDCVVLGIKSTVTLAD